MKLWVALVAIALLAPVACDEPTEENGVAVGRGVEEDDGCPDWETVAADDSTALEGTLKGDIDGDDVEDTVRLHLDAGAAPGCQAFVVVDVPSGLLGEPVWKIGREGGLPQPRLNSLVQIDGRDGLEIVVDEIAGASTQFVGAFTVVEGAGSIPALERIEPAEPVEDLWAGAAQGVFPYGGSVGHVEAVDCVGDGEIVVSVALPGDTPRKVERGIYTVTRRFFEVSGTELVDIRTEEEDVRFDFGETYPEFGSSPFGGCPAG